MRNVSFKANASCIMPTVYTPISLSSFPPSSFHQHRLKRVGLAVHAAGRFEKTGRVAADQRREQTAAAAAAASNAANTAEMVEALAKEAIEEATEAEQLEAGMLWGEAKGGAKEHEPATYTRPRTKVSASAVDAAGADPASVSESVNTAKAAQDSKLVELRSHGNPRQPPSAPGSEQV